ncbi:hypothetical protein BKA70DRAFT_1360282 [Coprinopsis sp. MPI-PUGE-AT-0042]|nr:hypothetical protein BKA70DRAFT_1360282 [Coprinopsis sp. MPI-PUGE-AT-0042]
MQPEPALVPYLFNNDPLPDHLQQSSSIYLAHLLSTITSLEQRLSDARAESPLEDLQKKREEYRQHLAPQSAIRRIPVEIIALILGHALCAYMPLNYEARGKLYQLIGVCSHWRRAALVTQELWAELSVDVQEENGILACPSMKRISHWFSRAGTRELRLDLSRTMGVDTSELIPFLTSLPRLSQLSVFPMKALRDYYTLINHPNNRNQLSRLTIGFDDGPKDLQGLNALDQVFPQLKDFCFICRGLGVFPLIAHAQLRALHLCRIVFPTNTSLSSYLCSLPALEELHAIHCHFPYRPLIIFSPPIHLSLKHFFVASGWATTSTVVFQGDLPICPKLERITVLAPHSYSESLLTTNINPLLQGFIGECQPDRLTMDLSHLSDLIALPTLIHTDTVHQLNVPDIFARHLSNALARPAFWASGKPPQVIVTRRPPLGISEVLGWATQFRADIKEKMGAIRFYSPNPKAGVEKIDLHLREEGFDFTFASQEEIDEMLGDPCDFGCMNRIRS